MLLLVAYDQRDRKRIDLFPIKQAYHVKGGNSYGSKYQ